MIFLYEFVSGGGCYSLPGAPRPAGSLLVEGRLMAAAVAEDLLRLLGMEIVTLRDARLDVDPNARFGEGQRANPLSRYRSYAVASRQDERREFERLAAAATGTLVIAPETGGALLQRVRWVLEAGGTLLGPGPALVELASNKHRLAEHLRAAGVPAPQGVVIAAGEPLPVALGYPAVLKPLGGAGSLDMRLVSAWSARERGLDVAARLEEFRPGTAASVAVLCGPGVRVALPACGQTLSDDGCFRYLGASTPLAAPLAARAETLALRAIGSLEAIAAMDAESGSLDAARSSCDEFCRSRDLASRSRDGAAVSEGPRGYVGVDMVLGPELSGAQDVVIEVNPRLTTSYAALRQSLDQNLMAAMLAVLQGNSVRLCGAGRAVQFDLPNGSIES